MNPNPTCDKECRFRVSGGSTTCAYYAPIYDKFGVNINPDRNITTNEVTCTVCNRTWVANTCVGETKFTEILG
jgi:hypothetical protein